MSDPNVLRCELVDRLFSNILYFSFWYFKYIFMPALTLHSHIKVINPTDVLEGGEGKGTGPFISM